jgi:hypothetical protein
MVPDCCSTECRRPSHSAGATPVVGEGVAALVEPAHPVPLVIRNRTDHQAGHRRSDHQEGLFGAIAGGYGSPCIVRGPRVSRDPGSGGPREDDGTYYSCQVNGTYSGSTYGIWSQFESTTVANSWVELSNTAFDRLGTRTPGTSTKQDGVLEFWVRQAGAQLRSALNQLTQNEPCSSASLRELLPTNTL